MKEEMASFAFECDSVGEIVVNKHKQEAPHLVLSSLLTPVRDMKGSGRGHSQQESFRAVSSEQTILCDLHMTKKILSN